MSVEATAVTLRVTAILEGLSIPYVIGGTNVGAVHGVARSTLDADLVANIAADQVPALVERLRGEFYISEEALYDAIARRTSANLIHFATMFKVNLFIPKLRPFDLDQLARGEYRAVTADPEQGAMVATAEDTILAKLEWYRQGGELSERQWRDVLGILRVQGDRLEQEYLWRMAGELGVEDLLVSALSEAR
jgi:hypothetical protein